MLSEWPLSGYSYPPRFDHRFHRYGRCSQRLPGAFRQYDAALMHRTDSMLTVKRAKADHRDASEAWAGWVFEWSLGFQLPLGEATRLVTYEKGYQDPGNTSSFFPEAVRGLGFLGTYMNIAVLKNCRPPCADVLLCKSCQHRVWFGQRTPDGERRIFPIEVQAGFKLPNDTLWLT